VRASDKSGRVDLRELPLVTIDGADARDFDDAVFTEARGSGWRLVVAIADVSHYVRSHDALDEEAARRGTSAYFPDRVVPMLPEQLSNGLCSLNPGVDRLCMVADMTVDRAGEVSGTRFYRAVMRSHQRLVYEDVQAAHDGERGARQRLRAVLPQLQELYGVYAALLQARERRGALDLELPEVKIELGAHGGIERISLRQRTDAHRLIEECMIAANVQAARFLKRHRLPTLYRVHAGPAEEKFEALRLLLQSLGIKVSDAARSRTRDFNAVLRTLRARPDYPLLATAVLRSMAQAVYQPENIGHFGLALSCYTHFTSPIRRYPDLLVHRGIGHVLDGLAPGRFAYYSLAMAELGERSSARERRADEAARHVEARYKCAWMRDRVGEVLPGVITGVTGFGIFVMLDELAVDGLVHVSSLGRDYFQLQPGGLRLVGERSGREFSLGVRLRVRVVRVDVDQARIDLALADEHAGSGSHPPANRRRHASTLPRRPR
jgi:ribonuclease R